MNKITDITQQKRNQKRYNLFIDGEFFIGVSDYVLVKNKLEIGKEIDKNRLFKIAQEDSYEKAKEYSFRYLMFQPENKVRKKLLEKGYEEFIVNKVISLFRENKYIDDENYAKRYTRDSITKKRSKRVIGQKLREKGISQRNIQKGLEDITENQERKNVQQLIELKIKYYQKKSQNQFELKNRMYQFLMRKGFPSNIIQSELGKYLNNIK